MDLIQIAGWPAYYCRSLSVIVASATKPASAIRTIAIGIASIALDGGAVNLDQ